MFDIDRRRARRQALEQYRMWPGHRENRVTVEGVDRHLEQLVLMVHEQRRPFQVRVSKDTRLPSGTRVLRTDSENKKFVWIEQWTTERKRHFLCGMDEQHLFIAQLPRPVSTVHAAHIALRPPQLHAAEQRAGSLATRQGEWFFVRATPEEEKELATEISARRVFVRKSTGLAQAGNISRSGRAHLADEVVLLAGNDRRLYARGNVRHPDHKTVYLDGWRRVFPNLEAPAAIEGLTWVD